jgi:hypothetical protein
MNDGMLAFRHLLIYGSAICLSERIWSLVGNHVPRSTSTRGKVWTRGTFHGTMWVTHGVQERANINFRLLHWCAFGSSQTSMLSHSRSRNTISRVWPRTAFLLSRTKFQHMSGTRAAMDFVETPSHLVEEFRAGSILTSLCLPMKQVKPCPSK